MSPAERVSDRRVSGRKAAGRRPGDSGTRAAIGEAARAQFADLGYHGATIRGIAAAADVDPALIHHYYGTKEALFADAMRLPVVPSETLTAALANRPDDIGLGAHLVRTAITLWESAEVKDTFLGLLRSAVTSEQASVMLREFIADTILATVAKATGLDRQCSPAEAEFRATLVATQMLGLALTRLVLGLPGVAEVSVDELAAAVGPSVDRYLTGDIGEPARASMRKRQARKSRSAETKRRI
jgi:AcrR family transcriptional regulator